MNQPWSLLQDKLFERALVLYPDQTPNRWELIARQVPGKSPAEIRRHYEDLVYDVMEIESGRVELPEYDKDDEGEEAPWSPPRGAEAVASTSRGASGSRAKVETERRKGVPWTEEEHRLFLMGLQRYGKGDWRSISRNAVVSRTPTQVASHAQKYFLRLSSVKKDKKRASIHDVAAGAVSGLPGPTHIENWAGLPLGPPSVANWLN